MSIQNERAGMPAVSTAETKDGFSGAYRYRDPRTRMYEVTTDRHEAERLVGDDYETVRVHFTDGCIDRIIAGGDCDGAESAVPDVLSDPAFFDELLEWLSSGASADDGVGSGSEALKDPVQVQHIRRTDHPENGIGLAYRYTISKSEAYGWTPNMTQARTIAGDDFETFWVRYRNGRIDHAITIEEWREELDVRVGERISEGLSREKLNEFDLIKDQNEATRWLEENRPDYRDICRKVRHEMERGFVMDGGEARCPEY